MEFWRTTSGEVVDGFKCSCVGLDADLWKQNKLLDFALSVSDSTGEILTQRKEAKTTALTFVLSPKKNGGVGCYLSGSLHKYKNGGVQNWDDFTINDIEKTLDQLSITYNIDLTTASLHSLEIGVNIPLNYQPKRIIESAICHKGKGFESLDRKDKHLGVICEHTDYSIKLYDKSRQCKIKGIGYILRYEVKFKRMRMLEKCGIYTLSDLKKKNCLENVLPILISKLKEIIFFDFYANTSNLTNGQLLRWERFGTARYWEGLNRNMYYKTKLLFSKLIVTYGAKDGAELLAQKVSNKYHELCQVKQKTGRRFPEVSEAKLSTKRATFSKLEYVLENVACGGVDSTRKNKEEIPLNVRHCFSCGRDISKQRAGSRFCSEKLYGNSAKQCRNKDSNRRMIIKRKIIKAMEEKLMLRITYADEQGIEYTDILGDAEIELSRLWLDRVRKVAVLRPTIEHLNGKRAKEYLLTIKNKENENGNGKTI